MPPIKDMIPQEYYKNFSEFKISFSKSNSCNYTKVIDICNRFSTSQLDKNGIHSVTVYNNNFEELENLLSYVANWKSTKLFINGKEYGVEEYWGSKSGRTCFYHSPNHIDNLKCHCTWNAPNYYSRRNYNWFSFWGCHQLELPFRAESKMLHLGKINEQGIFQKENITPMELFYNTIEKAYHENINKINELNTEEQKNFYHKAFEDALDCYDKQSAVFDSDGNIKIIEWTPNSTLRELPQWLVGSVDDGIFFVDKIKLKKTIENQMKFVRFCPVFDREKTMQRVEIFPDKIDTRHHINHIVDSLRILLETIEGVQNLDKRGKSFYVLDDD